MSRNLTQSRLDDALDEFNRIDDHAREMYGVLAQSVRDSIVDSIPQWAAALAWYALFSALPLFLVGGAIASFFVEAQWAADQIASLLDDFIPQGDDDLEKTIEEAFAARGEVGLIAFAGLIFTGTRMFDTLIRAMNIAFDTGSSYGFFKRLLIEGAMLLSIGALAVLALMSGFLTRLAWEAVRFLPAQEGLAYAAISWSVRAGLLFVTFYLIYRYVPRGNGHARSAAIGATVAAGLIVIVNPIFQHYVQRFGSFNAIYGSLAILAIIMVWIYIASLITLFGGEVASHAQEMLYEGRSAEEVGRRHNERSTEYQRLKAQKAAAPGAE